MNVIEYFLRPLLDDILMLSTEIVEDKKKYIQKRSLKIDLLNRKKSMLLTLTKLKDV